MGCHAPATVTRRAPVRSGVGTPTAASVGGLVVLLLVAAYAPLLYLAPQAAPSGVPGGIPLDALAFALAGTIIARRRPGHRVGWILIGVALTLIVMTDASLYTVLDYRIRGGTLPLGPVAGLLNLLWAPGVLSIPVVALLFPDGQLPSPRWRWGLGAYVAVGGACVIGFYVIAIGELLGRRVDIVPSTGDLADFDSPTGGLGVLYGFWAGTVVLGGLAACTGIFLNYRRSCGERRQVLKWFMLGAVVLTSGALPLVLVPSGAPLLTQICNAYFDVTLVALPISIGIGVLRYRLYDVDIVINRALVYGSLALLITMAYVGFAVGLGSLVGGGRDARLGLALLATAAVAVGFQPVRTRLEAIANRLVYGTRAAPYDALARLSEHAATASALDVVMPAMTRILAESTAALRSDVWLRRGNALHPAASWPVGAPPPSELALEHDFSRVRGTTERVVPVRHQNELLGALGVTKRVGEALTHSEENLLSHLAYQAGVLLKNAELTAALQARLEDLRASRQRLVIAQDTERKRLEANLHDGAQQHLIALKVKLGLAQALTELSSERASMLAELQEDADQALESLRELARGIHPAVLSDHGLAAALRAAARTSSVPVAVEAAGLGRYPPPVEAALYFCALEALQNSQKHADASRVVVRLRDEVGAVHLEVTDDGCGFDAKSTTRGTGLTNIADRIDALGGTLDVHSRPGHGCTISATVRPQWPPPMVD